MTYCDTNILTSSVLGEKEFITGDNDLISLNKFGRNK